MNPRRLKITCGVGAGIILLCTAIWRGRTLNLRRAGIASMKRLVRSRFPSIRQLSTRDLAEWLGDNSQTAPVLLDVREPSEFAVSHLPGARQVSPKSDVSKLAPTLPRNRSIVLYCSVGYRSSVLATRLIECGFTNVWNLEGSIFQWANEGRALERDGKPARTVHPYNSPFGRLLEPGVRGAVPGSGK